MRPVIFSGTTEGRKMSEQLSAAGIAHIVCVATGYGELVMEKTPFADIRIGRLSALEMYDMIKSEADKVFDATHPYAAKVSHNILTACRAADKEYVRVLREDDIILSSSNAEIKGFESAEACAEALAGTEGNILLTTGSKEISVYAAEETVRKRLFARVLPSHDSISLCEDAGLKGKQIIAMQGPFSREMDLAVIRQYDIKTLVTKASGRAGGLDEKLMAAAEEGIKVFVIGRPAEEPGLPLSEALNKYFGIAPKIRIDLIGAGPGRDGLMTIEASDAVNKADIIAGAPRMLKNYEGRETYPYYLVKDVIPLIERRAPERLAVLFSGDSGFYSGALKMRSGLTEWLGKNGFDFEIDVHPGVSSISYFASKIGETYHDAVLCSMHGRSDEETLGNIIHMIRTNRRTYVLLSGPSDVQWLGSAMADCGLSSCTIILGKDLSYSDERIGTLNPLDALLVSEKGLYTALVINEQTEKMTLTKAVSDAEFSRGKVPMTKENIRHLSILKLGLTEDAILYDVGSGTGSVACEAALLSSGIKVYAIEKNDEACGLIRENAARLGLANIEVIHGIAPDVLEGLYAPTHVFIGGSSGKLKSILHAVSTAPWPVKVVINAVSLETIAEIQSISDHFELKDLLIEQISISRSKELGSYHLMTAENPVMIASFTLGGRR